MTLDTTLPIMSRLSPVRPWLPMMIVPIFRFDASETMSLYGSSPMCMMISHLTPRRSAFAFIPSRYLLMSFSSFSADCASHNSISALTSITCRTYKVLEQAPAISIASRTAALLNSDPSVATSSFSNPGVGHTSLAIAVLLSSQVKILRDLTMNWNYLLLQGSGLDRDRDV